MSSLEQDRVEGLIPQKLLDIADPFVSILKKYYEYMNLPDNPSEVINRDSATRDVAEVSDFFLQRIYSELGESFYINKDNVKADTENILANLRLIYEAKGTSDSVKVLFRIVFGEEVDVWYPKDYILRASDGDWMQDYSITAVLTSGIASAAVGERVLVTTQLPGQASQTFETEITNIDVLDVTNDVYKIFFSRFFVNIFYSNSTIVFQDTSFTIKKTLSEVLHRQSDGTNFARGDSYNVVSHDANYSLPLLASYPTYEARVQKYYNANVYTRNLTGTNESVSAQSYTTGLKVTSVTNTVTNAINEIITYGQTNINISYNIDGSKVIKTTQNTDALTELSSLIDWDKIVIELVKVANGEVDGDYYTFLTTVTTGGFARGDILNTGTVTIDDVESLVRRLMTYSVPTVESDWILVEINDALLASSYPQIVPDDGVRGRIRPIETGPGGDISTLRIAEFGYDYNDYAITTLEPTGGGDPAVLIIASDYVGKSAPFYSTASSFLSESVIRLQDNFFYQDFSYVIRGGVSYNNFIDILNKTVHAAGTKAFAELTVSSTVTLNTNIQSGSGVSLNYNTTYADEFIANDSVVPELIDLAAYETLSVGNEIITITKYSTYTESGYFDEEYVDGVQVEYIFPPELATSTGTIAVTEIDDISSATGNVA